MNRKPYLCLIILILVFSTITVGCGVSRNVRKAKNAEDENRWQHAVGYYEKAYQKSIIKNKTIKLVEKSKDDAADYYYREATFSQKYKSELLKEMVKALADIQKSIEYRPLNEKYINSKNEIEKIIVKLENKIAEEFKEAMENAAEKKYLAAVYNCENILNISPDNLKAKKLMKNYRKKGHSFFINKGLKREKKEEYKSSVRFLEIACELFKTEQAEEILKRVKRKNKASILYNENWKLISSGEYIKVLPALRKMVIFDRKNNKYRALLANALFKNIVKCTKKKSYRKAIELTQEVKLLDFKSKKLLKNLTEIEDRVVGKIIADAEKDTKLEFPGNTYEALLWLDQRGLLHGKDMEKLQIARDHVLQYAIPSLEINAFSGSSEENENVGFELSNFVSQKMYQNEAFKCNISLNIEPSTETKPDIRWKYANAENDDLSFAGKLNGTSLVLKGYVDSSTFKHSIDKIDTQKSFISHYEKVINPAYEKHLKSDAGVDFDETGHRDLDNALFVIEFITFLVDLVPPPKYIEQPVYKYHSYTIEEHKVESEINCSIAVIDKKTGKIVFTRHLSETLKIHDSYVPGNIQAKLENDPLEIKSDYLIKEQLKKNIVDKISNELDRLYKKIPEAYLSHEKNEKLLKNFKKAKEFKIMSAVFSQDQSTLADNIWPYKLNSGFDFIESDDGFILCSNEENESQICENGTLLKINNIPVIDKEHALRLMANCGTDSLIKVEFNGKNKNRDGFILNPM